MEDDHPHVGEDDIPKHIQEGTEFTDEDPVTLDDHEKDLVWGDLDADNPTA